MLGFVAGLVLWQLPGGLDGLSYQKIGFGVMGIALVALVGTSLRHRALTSAVAFTWTPAGTVAELIKSWQPQGCKTHRQYQKSLAEHLAEKLPDVKLTLESGSSRVRADIELGKAVIVELKVDFTGTAKLQQLIGQIELYKREFPGRTILIILVGTTDRNTLRDLKEAVAKDVKVWVIRK